MSLIPCHMYLLIMQKTGVMNNGDKEYFDGSGEIMLKIRTALPEYHSFSALSLEWFRTFMGSVQTLYQLKKHACFPSFGLRSGLNVMEGIIIRDSQRFLSSTSSDRRTNG